MTKPEAKTICVRGFEAALYAEVKAQAKAEGMLIKDWIERAVTHELVRARKEQVRMEADLSDSSS